MFPQPETRSTTEEQEQQTYCECRDVTNPFVFRSSLPDDAYSRVEIPAGEREGAVIIVDASGKFRHMEEIAIHVGGGMSPAMESEYLAYQIADVVCEVRELALNAQGLKLSEESFVNVHDTATGTLLGETWVNRCLSFRTIPLVRRLWTRPYERFDHTDQFLGWFAYAIPKEISCYIRRRERCPCCTELPPDVVTELKEVRWGERPWDDTLLANTQIELWDIYFGKESTFPQYALNLTVEGWSSFLGQTFKMVTVLRQVMDEERKRGRTRFLRRKKRPFWETPNPKRKKSK